MISKVFSHISDSVRYWAWCHMAWNIPLASWDQLSLLCPHPTSLSRPVCALSQQEKLNSPWLVQTLLRNNWKRHCGISIILILNPKHSTAPIVLGTKWTQSQLKSGQQESLPIQRQFLLCTVSASNGYQSSRRRRVGAIASSYGAIFL